MYRSSRSDNSAVALEAPTPQTNVLNLLIRDHQTRPVIARGLRTLFSLDAFGHIRAKLLAIICQQLFIHLAKL